MMKSILELLKSFFNVLLYCTFYDQIKGVGFRRSQLGRLSALFFNISELIQI